VASLSASPRAANGRTSSSTPATLHPIGDRVVRLAAPTNSPAGVQSWSTFTFAVVDGPGKTN